MRNESRAVNGKQRSGEIRGENRAAECRKGGSLEGKQREGSEECMVWNRRLRELIQNVENKKRWLSVKNLSRKLMRGRDGGGGEVERNFEGRMPKEGRISMW